MPCSKSLLTCLFIFAMYFAGCSRNENGKDNQRQQAIQKKERELLVWENQLKSKEKELTMREQRMDSINKDSINLKPDTAGTYNPKLVGNWSVRMRCTETTCASSAIGDTRTEQWNISYQNNKIIVKASSNNMLTRIYKGIYKENNLKLTARQGGENETTITINLRQVSQKKMEGIREIYQENVCKIIYSLEIERS